jgi:hypothetical protein
MHSHEDASVLNLSWALRRFTSPSRLSSFSEAAPNALDSAEALTRVLAPAPPCIRAPCAEARGHVPCAMLCSGTHSRSADAHTAATAHAEAVKRGEGWGYSFVSKVETDMRRKVPKDAGA